MLLMTTVLAMTLSGPFGTSSAVNEAQLPAEQAQAQPQSNDWALTPVGVPGDGVALLVSRTRSRAAR